MVKGDKVLGIVFPNMRDETVRQLTKLRSMASVPFGGRYRLIDFTLSELVAAGIDNVGLVVRRNYMSLMDHLGAGREYDLARKIGGLKIFPPFVEAWTGAYRGKIEALDSIIDYIESVNCEDVILADSGIVSAIDYSDVLIKHSDSGARITALYKKEVIRPGLRGSNVTFELDGDGQVTAVLINEEPGVTANSGMWVYVIKKDLLIDIVRDCVKKGLTDFERDVLQRNVGKIKICGYRYDGYLKRISDLKSYFDANLDLIRKDSMDSLFSHHPVYTKIRDDAPVRYAIGSQVRNVIAADGCYIEGYAENSVLFRGVKIGKGAIVRNCVLMQDTAVGDGAVLENVICDKNVVISGEKRLIGDRNLPVFIDKKSVV